MLYMFLFSSELIKADFGVGLFSRGIVFVVVVVVVVLVCCFVLFFPGKLPDRSFSGAAPSSQLRRHLQKKNEDFDGPFN